MLGYIDQDVILLYTFFGVTVYYSSEAQNSE